MRKVLTDEVVTTSDFTPLPGGRRALEDHFAVVVSAARSFETLQRELSSIGFSPTQAARVRCLPLQRCCVALPTRGLHLSALH